MEISTILVRKAPTYEWIIKDTKELISKINSKPRMVKIQKIIEMTKEEFNEFKEDLLSDRDFIKANKEYTYFLVKERGTEDDKGIIIDTAGYDYPRYAGVLVEGEETFKCTRCERYFIGEPAISRKDNESFVCSFCGMQEAVEDFSHKEIIEFCRTLQAKANELKLQISIKAEDGYEKIIRPHK